jgi:glucokinase
LDLGLVAKAKRYFSENKTAHSKILDLANGKIDDITFEIIIKASKENDKVAVDLITEAGERLGVKIAYLINIFNPEVVIIGRGVEAAGNLLLDVIRKTVKKWAYEEAVKTVRIIPTKLGEDAVAVGAASVAMQQLFIKM